MEAVLARCDQDLVTLLEVGEANRTAFIEHLLAGLLIHQVSRAFLFFETQTKFFVVGELLKACHDVFDFLVLVSCRVAAIEVLFLWYDDLAWLF